MFQEVDNRGFFSKICTPRAFLVDFFTTCYICYNVHVKLYKFYTNWKIKCSCLSVSESFCVLLLDDDREFCCRCVGMQQSQLANSSFCIRSYVYVNGYRFKDARRFVWSYCKFVLVPSGAVLRSTANEWRLYRKARVKMKMNL